MIVMDLSVHFTVPPFYAKGDDKLTCLYANLTPSAMQSCLTERDVVVLNKSNM